MIIEFAKNFVRTPLVQRCVSAWQKYKAMDLGGRSASLSFFTIISIFPMMAIVITVSGYFYPGGVIGKEITRLVDDFFPFHNQFILKNLNTLFTQRKTFELVGWVGLLLSARQIYFHLEKNINDLLKINRKRHFLFSRLLFFAWLIGVMVVLFTPFFLGGLLKLFAYFHIHFPVSLVSRGIFFILTFLLFLLVVMILPRHRLKRRRIFIAALMFSGTLELGKTVFRILTTRNLGQYNLVYGSLASMVVGALWIFYFYHMFLFFIYWIGRDAFKTTMAPEEVGAAITKAPTPESERSLSYNAPSR